MTPGVTVAGSAQFVGQQESHRDAWVHVSSMPGDSYELKLTRGSYFVMLGLLLITFLYLGIVYSMTMKARMKVFNPVFMKNFDNAHSKEFPNETAAP